MNSHELNVPLEKIGRNKGPRPSTAIYMVPVTPPLTEIHCAVSQRLFSETKSNAASAMSSTVPIRAAARVCASTALIKSADEVPSAASKNGFDKSVKIGPGARVLTVIP